MFAGIELFKGVCKDPNKRRHLVHKLLCRGHLEDAPPPGYAEATYHHRTGLYNQLNHYILPRDIRSMPKVGQIASKWEKSGSFSDQISVLLAH